MNLLVGYRTYLNLKIVRPNMNLLGKLFFNKSLEWREFLQQVYEGLIDRRGQIRERKPKQSIYTYPAPHYIYGIAAISRFLHCLAFDNLPKELQRLRCKVNFQALTFVPHINALREMLIKRLRYHRHPNEHLREVVDENGIHGSGKYAGLHLRFDKEWNPSKPRYLSLLKGALHSEIPYKQKIELWSPLAPQGWKPCLPLASIIGNSMKFTGYVQVFVDGGLNQQRMGICDAVANAKILNATQALLKKFIMWTISSMC